MISIQQVAEHIGASVEGDADAVCKDLQPISEAGPKSLTFIKSASFARFFSETAALAVIVPQDFSEERGSKILLRVKNPHIAMGLCLHLFNRRKQQIYGIHPKAFVSDEATLAEGVNIGPFAVVESGCVLEEEVCIGPNSVVSTGSEIGEGSFIAANVTIYDGVKIGKNVHIDAGSVIGADGFGWARKGEAIEKIPQIGTVVIEDNVSIGANTCIDRATIGETRIGRYSKLDNLVQVAHNVKVGEANIFAGQCGIAGSTKFGKQVTLAGQIGVVDNIEIGDNIVFASKSAIQQSLSEPGLYSGIPARKHSDKKRQDVVIQQLPELLKRIRALEKEVRRLGEEK